MKKLIKNGNVFDGHTEKLKESAKIIIKDGIVEEILQGAVPEENFDEVIDAGNRVVMPGLVDNHVHLFSSSSEKAEGLRIDERAIRSVRVAHDVLLRGFTTVRDAGGMTFGLKKSIDSGVVVGPRIYPSNAHISQTCGNGDPRGGISAVRLPDGNYTSTILQNQINCVADGVPEVLRAVREQFLLGASQIKLMLSGRVDSEYSQLQTTQFSYEEIKAAVDAAQDFGTYVMAHAYSNEAVKRAVRANVKCIEHGNLLDEETARMVADAGTWLMPALLEEHILEYFTPVTEQAKIRVRLLQEGFHRSVELINKYHLPILYGTDLVNDMDWLAENQLKDLVLYARKFGNFVALKAATGNSYEISKLTTFQNPYPRGKIGVLEEGAYADLLIVDGNPLEDIRTLADENNIRLIMKDADIYKNTL
ncbi:MAG: amidohydrolase family protein [Lachnospiraceae bacterium]|nr:amidohydrolase family protein [Lachnospiraceae bacterium]